MDYRKLDVVGTQWRRQSVIVCLRLGRPLELDEGTATRSGSRTHRCSCACEGPRLQEAALRGPPPPPRAAPARPLRGDPPDPPDDCPQVQVLPPLPLLPAAPEHHAEHHAEHRDLWMPNTRRLLLEPAPRRLAVRGLPYGGPALRRTPSFERTVWVPVHEQQHPQQHLQQRLHTEVIGVPHRVPHRMPLRAPHPSHRVPGLRVLRPEELGLRSPTLGTLEVALQTLSALEVAEHRLHIKEVPEPVAGAHRAPERREESGSGSEGWRERRNGVGSEVGCERRDGVGSKVRCEWSEKSSSERRDKDEGGRERTIGEGSEGRRMSENGAGRRDSRQRGGSARGCERKDEEENAGRCERGDVVGSDGSCEMKSGEENEEERSGDEGRTAPVHAKETKGAKGALASQKGSKRQWLLQIVRENFNEQIGLLVERFVRRPSHEKSVRRVPGVGRKVNINLQDFWRRSSGEQRHMKTRDLLGVYRNSHMDWKAFQKWLTKDLQFMPSCAKLTALSLDIYEKYWSPEWDANMSSG